MHKCLSCNQEIFKFKYCSKECRYKFWNQKLSLYKSQWNHENKTSLNKMKQNWLLKNPEKRKESSKQYRLNHKPYYTSYSALRSRHMQNAKIKSLSEWDLFYIEEFYDIAQKRNLEVDHIIPIKHSKVCGLHVPWNLQMLTRTENAKKSNKFQPDEDVVCIFKDKQ